MSQWPQQGYSGQQGYAQTGGQNTYGSAGQQREVDQPQYGYTGGHATQPQGQQYNRYQQQTSASAGPQQQQQQYAATAYASAGPASYATAQQGYDATAPVQQGYNAGAAPAQQGYTAGGTLAQQQGYGQPAASVGLGVDQQSKLAQIIAQASSMATQQGSGTSQAGNYGGTYGGSAGQQQSGAYGIAAVEQPSVAGRYGQSAQPQTSPYNQPNPAQYGQEVPAYGQQTVPGQPTPAYGQQPQQQPASASGYGAQQTASLGYAGQQTSGSQQAAYGAQQAAAPYAAQQASASEYAPAATLAMATGYGAQQQAPVGAGYGAQQTSGGSQYGQQGDGPTGDYAAGRQGVAAYGSNAQTPAASSSYGAPQQGASYQQQVPAAAAATQQQYGGSNASGQYGQQHQQPAASASPAAYGGQTASAYSASHGGATAAGRGLSYGAQQGYAAQDNSQAGSSQKQTSSPRPMHADYLSADSDRSTLTSGGGMPQYGHTGAPVAAAGGAYGASIPQQYQSPQQMAQTAGGGSGMQNPRPAVVGHLIPGPTGAASSYGGHAASSASGGYGASAAVRPGASRQGTLAGVGAQSTYQQTGKAAAPTGPPAYGQQRPATGGYTGVRPAAAPGYTGARPAAAAGYTGARPTAAAAGGHAGVRPAAPAAPAARPAAYHGVRPLAPTAAGARPMAASSMTGSMRPAMRPMGSSSSHGGGRGGQQGPYGSRPSYGAGRGGGRGPVQPQSASAIPDLSDSRGRSHRDDHDRSRGAAGRPREMPVDRSRDRRDRDHTRSQAPLSPKPPGSEREVGRDREREKPPRSRDEARRTSVSKRSASPAPARKPAVEYAAHVRLFERWHVPQHELTTLERPYIDMGRRYPQLVVSTDFTKLVACWTQEEGTQGSLGCRLLPLHLPVKFDTHITHMVQPSSDAPVAVSPAPGSARYSAKVLLCAGLDEAAQKALTEGASSSDHLHKLLKFLIVRAERGGKREGIMCIGGPVEPAIDGHPADGDSGPLIAAAMRHGKDQTGLMLDKCTQWLRLLELHYRRSGGSGAQAADVQAVTVVFIADADKLVPSAEDWPKVWEEQKAWQRKQEAAQKPEEIQKDAEKPPAAKDEALAGTNNEEMTTTKAVSEANTEQTGDAVNGASTAVVKDEAVAEAEKPPVSDEAMDVDVKPDVAADPKPEAVAPAVAAATPAAEPASAGAAAEDTAAAKAAEEPVPESPVVLVRGKHTLEESIRAQVISLDGLLDYDEGDTEEATMEVSLAAEALQEMLSRDYGDAILQALLTERASTLRRREERKRKREEQEAAEKAAAAEKEKADAQKGAVEADAPAEPAAAEDGNGPAKRAKVEAAEDAAHAPNGSAAADGPAAQQAAADTGSKPESEAATEQPLHGDPAAAEAVKSEDAAVSLKADSDVVDAKAAVQTLAAAAPDVTMAEAEPPAAADSTVPAQPVADANGAAAPSDKGDMPSGDGTAADAALAAAKPEDSSAKAAATIDKAGAEENGKKEDAKPVEKRKRQYRADTSLLRAFRYFDRTGAGYIKLEDLRRLLHALGAGLPQWLVKELTSNVTDLARRGRPDRVYYRDLTDVEIKEGDGLDRDNGAASEAK